MSQQQQQQQPSYNYVLTNADIELRDAIRDNRLLDIDNLLQNEANNININCIYDRFPNTLNINYTPLKYATSFPAHKCDIMKKHIFIM